MSKSASAWVSPEQMAALHPTSAQMLYRFTDSSTEDRLNASLARATTGLPKGSLTGAQTYLTLKQAFSALADSYLPFMTLFGVLGLLVSALIVGNVVSGAVVSGYRHVGVLKALGFTPNQVVAVYLTMLSVPAVVGCVLGTLAGNALAGPILKVAFTGIDVGRASVGEISPWVSVACLVGIPALVLLAALVPALRARRLPAAEAISAGGGPRAGRGLRVQRMLGATRLPRPVSLGLGQPFARPSRTLLTMAAIVLGVTTVTLSTGLTSTMVAYGNVGREDGGARIHVTTGGSGNDRTPPRLSDPQIEKRLRSLPGVEGVRARALSQVAFTTHRSPVRRRGSVIVQHSTGRNSFRGHQGRAARQPHHRGHPRRHRAVRRRTRRGGRCRPAADTAVARGSSLSLREPRRKESSEFIVGDLLTSPTELPPRLSVLQDRQWDTESKTKRGDK
ncbi:FtsX-like permease family protein [Streptomyces leeuwenhoekii]|uniref:FtsX-like permease family protein n=1 Tax=Streptomyces leeuwenhoekii TaxID=1437453 RepID=UPI00369814CB